MKEICNTQHNGEGKIYELGQVSTLLSHAQQKNKNKHVCIGSYSFGDHKARCFLKIHLMFLTTSKYCHFFVWDITACVNGEDVVHLHGFRNEINHKNSPLVNEFQIFF